MRFCSIKVLKMHLVILGLMIALALIILVFHIAWHMMSALFLIADGDSNKTISMGLINPNVSAHSFRARVHSKKRCFNVSLSPLIESQFKHLLTMLVSNFALLWLEISLLEKKL